IKDALDCHSANRAMGYRAISIFSGDDASLKVLEKLWDLGVRYITLRSAGYNNIHVKAAKRIGFKVANTPDYSPHAIAEHAVALLLAMNRKLILADKRVHQYNFVQDGLLGFNLNGKTCGIIGTGRIGSVMAKIMHGFGCNILANDLAPNENLKALYDVSYTSLEDLCARADMISIHIPLTFENHYLINKHTLSLMKKTAVLINTSRGPIVDTKALIETLSNHGLGAYCTDVYEKEKGVFFKDHSKDGLEEEPLKKLLAFPNVLLSPHQAFIAHEALTNIAETTFENIDSWEKGVACKNELGYETLVT
ncbi:MAG: 2-hydroxyacid dehydrogenase, partial [Flavobacteriales bacterium]